MDRAVVISPERDPASPVCHPVCERAAVMTRAEEYRRLARQCLETARTISNEEGRATLVQMAQVWQRLADEVAGATEQLGDEQLVERPAPPATEAARPPAQQQQQIQPEDDESKKD